MANSRTLDCQSVQCKLESAVEAGGMPELTPEEREHVLSCPECRTVAVLVEAGLPPVPAAGEPEPAHVASLSASARAPEGLADSVMERVSASTDASAAPAIRPVEAVGASETGRKARIFRAIRVLVPLAAAAVLILMVLPPSYRTITSRASQEKEIPALRSSGTGLPSDLAKGDSAILAGKATDDIRADTTEFDGELDARRETGKAKEAATGAAAGPGAAMPDPGKKAQVLESKPLTPGDERPDQSAKEGKKREQAFNQPPAEEIKAEGEEDEAAVQFGAEGGVQDKAREEKADGEKGGYGTQVLAGGQLTLKTEAKAEAGSVRGRKQESLEEPAPAVPAARPEDTANAIRPEKLGREPSAPQPLTRELAAAKDVPAAVDRLQEGKAAFKEKSEEASAPSIPSVLSAMDRPEKPEAAPAPSTSSTPSTPNDTGKAGDGNGRAETPKKAADAAGKPGEAATERPTPGSAPESVLGKLKSEPAAAAPALSVAGKATTRSFSGNEEGGMSAEQRTETPDLAKGSPIAGAGTESPAAGAGGETMPTRGKASALRKSEALPSLERLCSELARLLKRHYPDAVVEKNNGRVRFACEPAIARKDSGAKMAKEVEARMETATSKVSGEITLHAGIPPLASQEREAAEGKPGRAINLLVTSSATKTYLNVRLSYPADTPKQFLDDFRKLFADPNRLLEE